MPIELVVFDMAGTTVEDDDAVGGCFRAALSEAGLIVDRDAVSAVMGLPKPEAIRLLVEASPARDALTRSIEAIHADFVAKMVRHYRENPYVKEVAGAEAVFAQLHRASVKVGLDTGFSRVIADIILQRLGWDQKGLVDATVTSDEVARGRPFPDMIQLLMRKLGVPDAARVAKVGDTPVDLEEGANAGCGRVIGVTRGTHTRAQLERYPHTDLLETVAELPGILGI